MDILDARTHRALAFVSALSEGGAPPTADALDEFYWWPGIMNEGAVIDREVWGDTGGEYAWAYLQRLGLAEVEGADEEDEPGVISLTAQGRAMLRHLDTAGAGKAELVEIVLEPSDPFAYPLVLLKLSELGPGLLVDAYCRAEQLRDLLQFEGISRVLMSARDSNQLQAVSIMLGRVENPGLEVRQSTAIHDRYFIPDAGPVLMLGMSLNGVGKKVGAITQLGDDASEVIRKTHEEFWAESLAVEPASTGGPSRGSRQVAAQARDMAAPVK